MTHHDRFLALEALSTPASLAELDKLWANPDLTALGIAQAWSAFHGFPISVGQMERFVRKSRGRYPDRRKFNRGLSGELTRERSERVDKDAPCDLWGAFDLVKAGTSPEEAARIARVPLAALKRFMM